MIDLHCHILPGIDDGAQTLEQSLAMARCAVADGITHIVATPHIHAGRYENRASGIEAVRTELATALEREGIELELGAAGEVRIGAEVMQLMAEQHIPFLGQWNGMNVVLLELPHSHIPPGSINLVRWFKSRGVLPMIAHPERNKAVMEDISKIFPFIEEGCLMQLTAMSVAGHFGLGAHERALEFLERRWATVIATDAHNLEHRPPRLREAFEAAASLIGEPAAEQLVKGNPAKLLGLTVAA